MFGAGKVGLFSSPAFGGATRQESVRNGLDSLAGAGEETPGIVLIHTLFGMPVMTLLFRNYYAGVPRQLLAVLANGSRVELLKRVKAPTLVIHGTEDPLTLPQCGKDTARHIPGAQLMMIEGMGHDFPRPLIGALIEAVAKHCRVVDKAA